MYARIEAVRKIERQHFIDTIYRLPLGKILVFGIKQAWAAFFGALLLAAIIITKYVELPWLSRYDWLFVFAILVQLGMLAFRLERPREVVTILVFHLVGLAMEVFKTSSLIGSWQYPEYAFFHVGNVPLFSGFMYATVGSYIARSWRVLELDFSHYPNRIYTALLAAAIYINFFSHHFAADIRIILFAAIIVLYAKTWVSYRLNIIRHRMPLLLGFVLISLFIWLAENIATFTKTWLYPNQTTGWHMVGVEKIGAWFLLMIISFILIDSLHYFYTVKQKNARSRIFYRRIKLYNDV